MITRFRLGSVLGRASEVEAVVEGAAADLESGLMIPWPSSLTACLHVSALVKGLVRISAACREVLMQART